MSGTQSVKTPPWMTLDTDERVLLRSSPSTNLLMAGVVGGFFLITLGSFPFIALGAVDAGRRTTFAITAIVVLIVIWIFLQIKRREYAVTSKRVSVASGLRAREIRSIDVEDVADVTLEQNRWQRWLSVGTLRFVTDGDDGVAFDLVGDPHYVYERALDFTQGSPSAGDDHSRRGSPM